MPELPEMEITARRLDEALPGERIESVLAPGINALKTFDPPLHALDGATITGVRRRGKHARRRHRRRGPLTLLVHLMSAGRMQMFAKRASLRDKTSRLLVRLSDDRELRLREFGTKQRAWVKVLTPEGLAAEESLEHLGPEAWPEPPADLKERLAGARPLHSLLRDQGVITGIGRTWVDEILQTAKLSPFKRGDDLSATRRTRCARRSLGARRVVAYYGEDVALPCPRSCRSRADPRHQGEPCPTCGTVLEAVFYEDYVMTYCPHEQTEGRVLKDRRLSRLLK